jgi:hypothetical protein
VLQEQRQGTFANGHTLPALAELACILFGNSGGGLIYREQGTYLAEPFMQFISTWKVCLPPADGNHWTHYSDGP